MDIIKKHIDKIIIISLISLLLIQILYFTLFTDEYHYPEKRRTSLDIEHKDIFYELSTYDNKQGLKGELSNFVTKKGIRSTVASYGITTLAKSIDYIRKDTLKPEIKNINILHTKDKTNILWQFNSNNYDNEKYNYNYIILAQYYEGNISEKVLLETKNNIELISSHSTNNKLYLFYMIEYEPEARELVGRKRLYIQAIDVSSGVTAESIKKIKLPESSSFRLHNANIIRDGSDDLKLVYHVKIADRPRTDILISNIDYEGNIKDVNNIPVELPKGVYNEMCSIKSADNEYMLAVSYTSIKMGESSVFLIVFDGDGQLKNNAFIKLYENTSYTGYGSDINIIPAGDFYFIFFKYEKLGYLSTILDKNGNIIEPATIIDDSERINSMTAVYTGGNSIIQMLDDKFRIINIYDNILEKDEIIYNSNKLKRDSISKVNIRNNNIEAVWVKDGIEIVITVIPLYKIITE